MIDLIQFLLALTSTTSAAGKHLSVVTFFQVRVEVVIGSFIGGGIMLFYYSTKYKSGNWTSGDSKSVGAIILGMLLASAILII